MTNLRPTAAVALLMLPFAAATPAQAAVQAAPLDVCAPQPAEGAPFAANTNRVGRIDLRFFNAQGAPVSYYECLGGGLVQPLGERTLAVGAITSLEGIPWRCGRLTRRFAATATTADGTVARGTTSVRTVSCADRLALTVPAFATRGDRVRIGIADRWNLGGVTFRLCVSVPVSPAPARTCRSVALANGVSQASRTFRPTRRGRWRAELQLGPFRSARAIAVGVPVVRPADRRPVVLATGDSTMQGLDSFLADEVKGVATVLSDVRPGSSMSLANGWAPVAAAQAARERPRITLMSMGPAEGFPMRGADGRTHACCDDAWVAEYTRRAGTAMRSYLRQGRSSVVWLTVPVTRDEGRATIVAAVNRAVVAAAQELPGVQVLRMDEVFSPRGYSSTIRDNGRDVIVREPDGVHLNVAGLRIEARIVAAAIRGILGRPSKPWTSLGRLTAASAATSDRTPSSRGTSRRPG